MATEAPEALRVPELLEMILLHLPLQDLLRSQKVDTFSKATWEGSVKIQRALFLQPVSDLRITLEERNDHDVWVAGPAGDRKLTHRPILNPFLSKYVELDPGIDEFPIKDSIITPPNPYGYLSNKEVSEHSLKATIARMLVLQPAASTMETMCWAHDGDEEEPRFHNFGTAVAGDHVLVSDMRRGFTAHLSDCRCCPFEGDEAETCWHWRGYDKVRFVDVNEEITGWEMLAKLTRRCKTRAIRRV